MKRRGVQDALENIGELMIRPLFSVLLMTALLSCSDGGGAQKERPAAPARVAVARQGEMPKILRAVGNVRASASVDLIPRVAGEIVAVNFTEGQEVEAGRPLIQIDPRPYEAALRERRAQLARSEAQLAKAMEDRRRYGKLVGGGYVSRDAYERTATDAAALKATAQADRAAVETAALDLAYCSIKAPIGGRIGALRLDRGNMIKSGSTEPIATIDAIAPCYVTFSTPEANLPAIQARMAKGPLPILATPTGGDAEKGFLTFVDNSVDVKTGAIPLRGTFQNAGRRLWPGQFVEVELPLGELENAVIVPSAAVQAGRDENYVYVIENGAASYRKVSPLAESGGETAVAGDVRPGEKVAVDGLIRLAPGMPVRVVE